MSRKPSPYVRVVVEEFLETKAPRERKTVAAYSGILLGSEYGTKQALGLPFAVFFHNRKFKSLTHRDVAAWFAQRVEGGAQATKHRISKNARAFLRFAFKRGYTTLDLESAIDVFVPGGSRTDALDWSEVHALLDAIHDFRYRFAATWLFMTGCRVNEAVRANQMDVRRIEDTGLYQWTIPDSKTHTPRKVWLPQAAADLLEESRKQNTPDPRWPILWDSEGRGFSRVENPASRITAKTINSALERARSAIGLPVNVTAHVAKHSYCSNWIKEQGKDEYAMEKLSRQVGTSVSVLRSTYVHMQLDNADWAHVASFGARGRTP